MNIENITTIAATLIIEGKATVDNALEMAIKIDSDKCLEVIEDISDMKRGYINDRNTNQKGYNIVMNSVYNNLSK